MRMFLALSFMVAILSCVVLVDATELQWETSLFMKAATQQAFPNSTSLFKPPFGANAGSGSTAFSAVPEYRMQYGVVTSSGAFQCSFNPGAALTGRVRELFVTAEYGAFRVSGGRKLLQWGTAYFFNPIGSFIPEKSATDISDSGKSNVGTDSVKVDYFSEHVTVSGLAYYKNDTVGYAGLLFVGLGAVDTYWLLHDKGDGEAEYGGACAFTINDYIELHAEAVRRRSYHTLAHRVHDTEMTQQSFGTTALYMKEYDAPWMWVVGTNITLGRINVIAEVYHSDAGIGASEWDKEKAYYEFHNGNIMNTINALDDLSSIWTLQRERQRFRDYAFLRVSGVIDSIDTAGMVIMNLYDTSVTGIATLSLPVTSIMSVSVNAICMGGERGSEFRESMIGALLSAELRISF